MLGLDTFQLRQQVQDFESEANCTLGLAVRLVRRIARTEYGVDAWDEQE